MKHLFDTQETSRGKQRLTLTLEAIVMWYNNGTLKWLNNLDTETKNKHLNSARKNSSEIRAKFKLRQAKIKEQRLNNLRKKQEENL